MTITSRQNPLVARFRDAARGDAGEMILLDGAHLVGEAIDAGISVQIAAVTPAASEKDDIRPLLAALARAGADIASVAAPVMDAISPVRSSSGIVALAERPPAADDRVYGAQPPLVVVAVDVQDPGNVGAIIRVAEAAGATGVVAAGASANPFGWKALRGSMGSGLRLPLASGPSPAAAVADAKRRGCRVIATAPREGTSLFDIDLSGPIAVLIGGEGPGLGSPLLDAADQRVTIPMQPPVESLNAAVTAALILYEARRQRSPTKHTKT